MADFHQTYHLTKFAAELLLYLMPLAVHMVSFLCCNNDVQELTDVRDPSC